MKEKTTMMKEKTTTTPHKDETERHLGNVDNCHNYAVLVFSSLIFFFFRSLSYSFIFYPHWDSNLLPHFAVCTLDHSANKPLTKQIRGKVLTDKGTDLIIPTMTVSFKNNSEMGDKPWLKIYRIQSWGRPYEILYERNLRL